MKPFHAALLSALLILLVATANAQEGMPKNKRPDLEIDLAVQRPKGDKMRGPATIRFKNVNVLRYDVEIGTDVKFTEGPKLDLPFIPKLPGATDKQGANKELAQSEKQSLHAQVEKLRPRDQSLDQQWKAIIEGLKQAERQAALVRGGIAEVVDEVNSASRDTLSLVATSDAILKAGGTAGAKAIVDRIPRLLTEIDGALKQEWPDDLVATLAADLQILHDEMIALPTQYPSDWPTWYAKNHTGFEDVKKRVETLLASVNAMSSAGDEGKKFVEAKDTLSRWHDILQGIQAEKEGAFTRTIHVGCGFSFDQNKETAVKVVMRDRLSKTSSSDGKDKSSKSEVAADTKQGEIDIVTVVCSSPFSISGGFGFSNIEEREFVFVQSQPDPGSTAKVVNRFGFKNRSSFRVIPLILLNTRVWEPNDTFAVHASVGVGVDVKTGQAGTDIEYFVGPSASFKRSLFVTPALHIGRVPSLVGGFKLNDIVPEGVSSPPVEKTWKKGFALTFTYKIR